MTAHTDQSTDSSPRLVETGIKGLDEILKGGLLCGGIYIVQGEPGTGKTILGNQICFSHAERGSKALYVTLLAESHSRMLLHMGSLQFFDTGLIPKNIYYISAFSELETNGLAGLATLLRKEVASYGADIVVVDGLVAAEKYANSEIAFKKFIHELQLQAAVLNCSVLLLTSAPRQHVATEHTMVDGVIELTYRLFGWRTQRDMRIHKRRGADFVPGLHAYKISEAGITIFPRIETLKLSPSDHGPFDSGVDGSLIRSGLDSLDGMIGGGLPMGSTTLVIGAPGVGKTTLGLHFLSESGPREKGLFLGFYETPVALRRKAQALGLKAAELMDSADVDILWFPAIEGSLDEVCAHLIEAVCAGRVRRLFIDGLEALQKLATDPARLSRVLSALITQLRLLGVTTIYTAETETLVSDAGPLAGISVKGASSIAENIFVMRFLNRDVDVFRAICVVKVRDSQIDNRVRLFDIGPRGLDIDTSPARAQRVFEGALGPTDGSRIPPLVVRPPSPHAGE